MILLPFCSFSQNIKPKITKDGYLFDTLQTKLLVKELIAKDYYKSLSISYEQQLELLNKRIVISDSTIKNCKKLVSTQDSLIESKELELQQTKRLSARENKKLKKRIFLTEAGAIVLFVLGILI